MNFTQLWLPAPDYRLVDRSRRALALGATVDELLSHIALGPWDGRLPRTRVFLTLEVLGLVACAKSPDPSG